VLHVDLFTSSYDCKVSLHSILSLSSCHSTLSCLSPPVTPLYPVSLLLSLHSILSPSSRCISYLHLFRNNLNCRIESSAKISVPDASVASVSPSNTEVHLSSLSNGNGSGNGNGMPPVQESACRARAVREVEVEEVRRSLRGPISASRGALRAIDMYLLIWVNNGHWQ
jgi:hypothetical protein